MANTKSASDILRVIQQLESGDFKHPIYIGDSYTWKIDFIEGSAIDIIIRYNILRDGDFWNRGYIVLVPTARVKRSLRSEFNFHWRGAYIKSVKVEVMKEHLLIEARYDKFKALANL